LNLSDLFNVTEIIGMGED